MTPIQWTPLSALAARFAANVAALGTVNPSLGDAVRAHAPVDPHFVGVAGDDVHLGVGTPPVAVPCPVPPGRVGPTVQSLFPGGACDAPTLIAGESLGWLWDRVYRLPCAVAAVPGYRPPLYLMIADVGQLWAILHLHDWQTLLADPRVQLFAGPDAAAALGQSMCEDHALEWPARWVVADPAVWPPGVTLDTLRAAGTAARTAALLAARDTMAGVDPAAAVTRIAGGRPLRVLGFTSLYTTFLRHSMRDWLAAFEALGHTVQLVEEAADHQTNNVLVDSAACGEFRPDLIVIIDHYRAELPGLPAGVPTVMWVQDRLPNIYAAKAGAAQGPTDFCLGFGRLRLSEEFGYPADRFLTCPVGTNVDRYAPTPSTHAERNRFAADVSYVSHASRTADQIIDDESRTASPPVARLLADVLARMKDHYARHRRILGEVHLRKIIDDAQAATRVRVDPPSLPPLMDLLVQRVNNALVRHQALLWVADAGVDLKLYGRGWDRHPHLARFARGEVDNRTDLSAVYRCSAVNLQVTPFGFVHQRVLDGLSAGGFFLARWHQVDVMGTAYRRIWEWCRANDVNSSAEMFRLAPLPVAALVRQVDKLHGYAAEDEGVQLYEAIRTTAEGGFAISADSIWGGDYAAVAFATRDELAAKLAAALADPAGRRETAARMRAAVVDRFSYRAITTQLLAMMARELTPAERPLLEAA